MIAVLAFLVQIAAAQTSPDACSRCHRAETQDFARAAMTQALMPAADSPVLKANPKLTTKIGEYSYEIVREQEGAVLIVSDASGTLRVPLDWAFGQGAAGQTFLFSKDNHWYESLVSYFPGLHGLDRTMGAQNFTPHNLLEAAGRVNGTSEARLCFNCHATNVSKPGSLDLSRMTAGVQCERCHGPTAPHLQTVSNLPRKLSALTTDEVSDFCGQCHRTWAQIAAEGPRGVQNVRFQPYRLANSKCYDASDRRIRCTACHDPHRPLETSTAAYDARCTACHSASAKSTTASAHLCRTGKRDCASCHMPRIDLPGAHRQFTDHRIRIARANQPYPD